MSTARLPRLALATIVLLLARHAWADDDDANALMLADQVDSTVAQRSDWRSFVEGSAGYSQWRAGNSRRDSQRLSLDTQYDHSLSPAWRLFVADRLDIGWPSQNGNAHGINTLKEAYLSWRAQPDSLLDAGRVNVRNGVATGYNPTDYFRRGAVRSPVSINPASLKENRQGSVMLRGQQLWDGGSLTALYAPELDNRPSSDGFSLNPGATNYRDRWLLSLSQKIGNDYTPQLLFYQEAGRDAQLGFNLTRLINDSTVAYLEWSGGRRQPELAQALQQYQPDCACKAWRNQLATGATYTSPNKQSLTVEYHYNGAALDREQWDALRHGYLPAYAQYRNWIATAQDSPTRQALFFYASWQDALLQHLDANLMHNVDLADHSRRLWFELRYHPGHVDYVIQWQRNSGEALSHFGAMPEAQSWQAQVRYYF